MTMVRALGVVLLLTLCGACSGDQASAPAPEIPAVPPPAPVAAVAGAVTDARPLVFIGLAGANWDLLNAYVERGSMPNLGRMVKEGTAGVLQTDLPAVPPMIWTTMLTGVSPLEHGILDFVQFNAETGVKEPIGSVSRRVPAIWNMLTNAGKTVSAIGPWATFPAEPVAGLLVSDLAFGVASDDAASHAGLVFPRDRERWVFDIVSRAEGSVDAAALRAMLPGMSDAEYRQHLEAPNPYAHPISALRRIMAETRAQAELGRAAMEQDHPSLTLVSIAGIDSVAQVFGSYVQPEPSAGTAEDRERYAGVPGQYLRVLDDELGKYRALAEQQGAVVMIASDVGATWPVGAPGGPLRATAASASMPGMYLLWGAGIAAGGPARRGTVDQVTPTLLALSGLPPGEGLPAVLPGTPTASKASAVNYRAFYTPVEPPPSVPGAASESESLAKLRSLGYIADAGQATARSGDVRTAGSYDNEGLLLRNARKTTEAVTAFEHALEVDPDFAPALWHLSELLRGRPDDAGRSDSLLVRAFGSGLPDGAKLLVDRATAYQRAGQGERALQLFNGALDAKPDDPVLWMSRGRLRQDRGDCAGAATDFHRAAGLVPNDAVAPASEGRAQVCAGDRAAARAAFTRSLELNPNQPNVRASLAALGRTP